MTMHEILSKKMNFNKLRERYSYVLPFLIEQENLRYKLINDKLFNPFQKVALDLVPKSSIEHRLAKYTVSSDRSTPQQTILLKLKYREIKYL